MKHTDRMSDSAYPTASRGLSDPALPADDGTEDEMDSKSADAAPARRPRQFEPEQGDGSVVRLAPRAFLKSRRAPQAPNGTAPPGDDDDPGPAAA